MSCPSGCVSRCARLQDRSSLRASLETVFRSFTVCQCVSCPSECVSRCAGLQARPSYRASLETVFRSFTICQCVSCLCVSLCWSSGPTQFACFTGDCIPVFHSLSICGSRSPSIMRLAHFYTWLPGFPHYCSERARNSPSKTSRSSSCRRLSRSTGKSDGRVRQERAVLRLTMN